MVFSRSCTSLADPTPPALRSELVKVDQLLATASTITPSVRTKPLRKPRPATAPTRTTRAKASHTARVCVRYTAYALATATAAAQPLSKRDSTACDAISVAARKPTMSTRPLTTG